MKKLVLFCGFLLILGWITHAQDGTLDSTFNSVGFKQQPGFYGSNVTCAVQPDGRIVVAGKNNQNKRVVMRFLQNGTPDSTFNLTGIVNSTHPIGNYLDAYKVLIQPDGKILVIGQAFDASFKYRVCVNRYNPDGTADATFGASGMVQLGAIGAESDLAFDAALLSSGKFVVGAYSLESNTGVYKYSVIRFNTDGTPDLTFDVDGIATIDLGCLALYDYNMFPRCGVAVQPDGKILFSGSHGTSEDGRNAMVFRLKDNGSLDSTFNSVGYVIKDFYGFEDHANDVEIDNNGKIVVVGKENQLSWLTRQYVMRYNENGTPDSTFGVNGVITFYLAPSSYDCLYKVDILSDNRIVAGGMSNIGTYNYATVRLTESGTLDNTFGTNGIVNGGYIGSSETSGYGQAIQPDGKIVVTAGINTGNYFNIARYKQKLIPDVTVWPTASAIVYGDSIGQSVLGGGSASVAGTFAFADSTFKPDSTGNYTVAVVFTPALPATYISVTGTVLVNVTQKYLTVSGISVQSKTYDGTDVATVTGATLNGIVGTDDVQIGTQLGTFDQVNIGVSVPVDLFLTMTGADSPKYIMTYSGLFSADIFPKSLDVINAVAEDKEYDGTNNAVITGATLSGVVGTENVVLDNSTVGQFSQVNVGNNLTVTTNMTLSGTAISNYILAPVLPLTADIVPKELTVTATVADKVYDGNDTAVIATAVLTGVVGTEDVVLDDDTTGTFAQSDAGTGVAVSTAMTVTGADIANYVLVQPTGLNANILQRELTINGSFEVSDKPFDGNTTASITNNQLTLVNTISGDDVSLSNVEADFAAAAVDSNVTVSITSADLTGTDNQNYVLLLAGAPTTTANILSGVGMEEMVEAEFSIYPNPAVSSVYVACDENILRLYVVNAAGQTVAEQTNDSSINVERLDTGLYMIFVQTENGKVLSGKFMKE